MSENRSRELIFKALLEKAQLKQEVVENTKKAFAGIKSALDIVSKQLQDEVKGKDHTITIEYKSKGEFEAMLRFESDTLLFIMHADVFDFDEAHNVWNSPYVSKENNRSFCGVISVYDFLSNSFKYDRDNDVGYLIARIFVNRESHYFVEGKGEIGTLFNDFSNAVIDQQAIESIVDATIMYSLDFDPLIPPYDSVKEVKVYEVKEIENLGNISMGKRLGFRFQADNDRFE